MGEKRRRGEAGGKYSKNPLVPVDGRRVLAAIERAGKTVSEVARKARAPQQTVNSIVKKGLPGRCRLRTRRNLARALEVSESWLSGSPDAPLPGLAPWAVHPGVRDPELPFQLDENLFRFPLEWNLEDAEERAARYQLAWTEVAELMINAWERDIENGVPEAKWALEMLRPQESGAPRVQWEEVIRGLQRLLSLAWWGPAVMTIIHELPERPEGPRGFFTRRQAKRFSERNAREWQRRRDESDELAVAGASFLRCLLRPWFDGQAEMHYETLVEVLAWANNGMLTAERQERIFGSSEPQ